ARRRRLLGAAFDDQPLRDGAPLHVPGGTHEQAEDRHPGGLHFADRLSGEHRARHGTGADHLSSGRRGRSGLPARFCRDITVRHRIAAPFPARFVPRLFLQAAIRADWAARPGIKVAARSDKSERGDSGLAGHRCEGKRMFKIQKRFVAIGIAMFAAAGLALALTPTDRLADKGPKVDLETLIPDSFGNWKIDKSMVPIAVSPDVQARLDRIYNQTLARTYVNDNRERVMLSI